MAKETTETFCQKAQEALAQGKNLEAQLFYKQALGLRPDNPDAHYGLATTCFLLGELPLAAYHFKEVTRIDPARAGAFINLGAVYNRLEQFDDAITALRRGIQLDINRGEGFYNLGLVYRRKGQPDMAVQAYREATRINPRMADAHFNIANIFLEKTQYGLAIAHYRQALEIRPTWEKALRGLEQAEASQKDVQSRKLHETSKVPEPEVKSQQKAAPVAALHPDRLVDPMIHGELLRTLHRVTIDSENQGAIFSRLWKAKSSQSSRNCPAACFIPTIPPRN